MKNIARDLPPLSFKRTWIEWSIQVVYTILTVRGMYCTCKGCSHMSAILGGFDDWWRLCDKSYFRLAVHCEIQEWLFSAIFLSTAEFFFVQARTRGGWSLRLKYLQSVEPQAGIVGHFYAFFLFRNLAQQQTHALFITIFLMDFVTAGKRQYNIAFHMTVIV